MNLFRINYLRSLSKAEFNPCILFLSLALALFLRIFDFTTFCSVEREPTDNTCVVGETWDDAVLILPLNRNCNCDGSFCVNAELCMMNSYEY